MASQSTSQAFSFPQKTELFVAQTFIPGFRRAWPLIIAYFPLAMAFGLAAANAGLPLYATFFMSAIVYTGAAQFVAVGMMVAGQSVFAIAVATFFINFRYFIYSSVLATPLQNWLARQKAWAALEVTDETFAVLMGEQKILDGSKGQIFVMTGLAHLSWVTGSVLGHLALANVSNMDQWGLHYVLPAMLTTFLILQLKGIAYAITALFAIGIALACHHWGLSRFTVVLAAAVAPIMGLVWECTHTKKSS